MNKKITIFKNLLKISRPVYSIPVILASISGYLNSPNGCDSLILMLVIISFFSVCLGCWAANEITDREYDSAGETKQVFGIYISGGTNILNSGQLTNANAIIYSTAITLFGNAVAFLVNINFFILMFLFTILLMGYSIEPIRFKRRGFLGLIIVSITNGFLPYIAGQIACTGSAVPPIYIIYYAILLSALSFGFDGISHLLDYVQDKKNDERTIVVSLGVVKSSRIFSLAIVLSCSITFVFLFFNIFRLSVFGELFMYLVCSLCFLISLALIFLNMNTKQLASIRLAGIPIVSLFAIVSTMS